MRPIGLFLVFHHKRQLKFLKVENIPDGGTMAIITKTQPISVKKPVWHLLVLSIHQYFSIF